MGIIMGIISEMQELKQNYGSIFWEILDGIIGKTLGIRSSSLPIFKNLKPQSCPSSAPATHLCWNLPDIVNTI